MARLVAKDWPRPFPQIETYYVRCANHNRVEGQYITENNRLTVGTGTWAQKYIARGWRFEDGEWVCPEC